MFTGIIETTGKISRLESKKNSVEITVSVIDFTSDIKLGSSIAANGVCLTVVRFDTESFTVEAVQETLSRSNLSRLKPGSEINLEKAAMLNDRLDGHIVQGHVDGIAKVDSIIRQADNFIITFRLPQALAKQVVEKGSISVDGISLTVAALKGLNCSVAIVPFTRENTTIRNKKIGDTVNIETDIIGKYVEKLLGKQYLL